MRAIAVQQQNGGLYAAIALSCGFLLVIALGPGIFTNQYLPFSWHYSVFEMLCHQNPDRSYHLGINSMAVCSRCFGIYISFFLGWLILPLVARFAQFSKDWEKKLFTAAILLNLADILANFFAVWTNNLDSRFILGSFLGLATALFLMNQFFKTTKPEN